MTPPPYSIYQTKKFVRSFEKIVTFYRDKVDNPIIGQRFVGALRESLKRIQENPGRSPYYVPHPLYQDILEKKLRAFQMRSFSPFPYILYYSVDKSKITIHYLFHSSQDRSHLLTIEDLDS